jgi:tripartite-type tricarboxylate transporter receptor subunit TctC
MHRRSLCAALALPAIARAQPATPLRLVVPFPAGGATDTMARLLAPALAAGLGQSVVIDNRPGAGGVPAAELVVRAAPDGNTLLLATSSIHSTGPALNPRLPYDVERDFLPLALIAAAPSLVLVAATVPATTLPEFLDWARARRGQINYGSSGIGGAPHLNAALLDARAGTGMVHVPYRGTGAVYAEMRRGDVHLLVDVTATAAPHLAGGVVRALAHTGRGASALAPGLPAVEATLPGYVSETWFGLYGPAGLPPALAARVTAAAIAAMTEPSVAERVASLGAEARPAGGDTLRRVAAEERERWTTLVRDLGIKATD